MVEAGAAEDPGVPLVPAVFLDKDGVIVDNSGYPDVIPTSSILPCAEEGLRLLGSSGLKVFIISNQSWIGKGRMSREEVDGVFHELYSKIERLGLYLAGWYYCPHDSKEGCACRKPSPFLVGLAAKEHGVDLSRSYFIGDMTSDILCARRAGLTSVLVQTGRAGRDGENDIRPDIVAADLSEAVRMVLGEVKFR